MPALTDDIRSEKLIHKTWNFKFDVDSPQQRGVLVTGPNSFIGSHIVKNLSLQWEGPVYLLLRAASIKEAGNKMTQAFQKWALGDFNEKGFNIVLGDVNRNMMGLSTDDFRRVRNDTGTVIHLAMNPLYHLPYQHFQRVWLPELERMITFCGDHRAPKSLHYASSFNANFFETDEDFKSVNSNAWQSGYAGFKWVASAAIKNAFSQNLKGAIYDIPLVLGSESQGLCPAHYSIWMILDMFLRTGLFFPFQFRIIPVDILSEIIVTNAMKSSAGRGTDFVRPALAEPVTDLLFARLAAGMLGLQQATVADVREACRNKLRFDFMVPENFYELLEKVNNLRAVFPVGYDEQGLPLTPMVFMSNLNRVLGKTRMVMET